MAKEEGMQDKNISRPSSMLHTDNAPIDQPKDSYRMALNAMPETDEGEQNFISNEGSNLDTTGIRAGCYPLGDRYIGDGVNLLFSVNPTTNTDYIGILDSDGVYKELVETQTLGFRITNQIKCVFRVRRGNKRTVYWVDGNKKARTFNVDAIEQFYSVGLKAWLEAGNPISTYVGEKFDGPSFDLIKGFNSIPTFDEVEILTYGSILPGSYNFTIQYMDDNLNPTGWITTSNTINIFNDTLDKSYAQIRGSRNITTDAQAFSRASKSIKLTIGNLDTSFPFYRVAIIQATSGNGKPTRALTGGILSTQTPTFLYSGNDEDLSEVSLEEIEIDGDLILAPNYIEQLENRLILGDTKSAEYNWCGFQHSASVITSNLVTQSVNLADVTSQPNQKNPYSTFKYRGYMPGEVYSFGIIYYMKDGSVSPVFHIPGKNASVTNDMDYHQLDSSYIDIHNCYDGNKYWGVDSTGAALTGTPIRHHKFKNRKQLSKPLITTVDQPPPTGGWYLRLNITLAAGKSWPLDGSGNPLTIQYAVVYTLLGFPTTTYTSYLSISDLGQEILIYQDVYQIDPASFPIDFDSACELMVTYEQPGSETFDYGFEYGSTASLPPLKITTSEIFGISFSNVQQPHPDVIGFQIVRNERYDDDRIVADNAIMGLNVVGAQYTSFGLLMPKMQDSKKSTNSNWFFSPEHQFLKKQPIFTSVDVQGAYKQVGTTLGPRSYAGTGVPYPAIPPFFSTTNNKGIKGVLVQDVYPGTSYNSQIHTKNSKDDDGFSLAIGYRNLATDFVVADSETIPDPDKTLFIDAAYSKIDNNKTYYNTSCDNRIAMTVYPTSIDLDQWKWDDGGQERERLLYVSLTTNNRTSYYDFITRDYFKEHNNMVEFITSTINGFEVYNGDAFISPSNLVSSVFWEQRIADRQKKNKTWEIILGAALLVTAGVLIATGVGAAAGAAIGAAAVSTITTLVISYAVSLIASGIKFEQMKSMIDNDYPQGLKDTIRDQDTMYAMDGQENYPGPLPAYPDDTNGQTNDDMFMWWMDRVSNLWVESSIPYAIRVGLTSGTPDFVDAPNNKFDETAFQSYITNKLTVIDKEQGSGRLYKGYPSAEFYDANLDYMRFNKEKTFIHLPVEYDCCHNDGGSSEAHPLRYHYSQQSFQEEQVDSYRTFQPNNYRDLEGEHGEITDMYRLGNSLFIHTEEGCWHLPQNVQERVTSEIVSFIGTGDFFSIPPRKLVDDNLGSAGTKHCWATVKTNQGVFFISAIEGKVYVNMGDSIKEISGMGMSTYFRDALKGQLSAQLYKATGLVFPNTNNPTNPSGVGCLACHDVRYKRILFSKRDYLIKEAYIPTLDIINSVPDSVTVVVMEAPHQGLILSYNTSDGVFYTTIVQQTDVDTYLISFVPVLLNNTIYFEDRGFTISFSLEKKSWIGWHSYIPSYYLYNQETYYSYTPTSNKLWKHNQPYTFQTYYGVYKPFILEYVSISSPIQERIWEDVTIQSVASIYDEDIKEWVVKPSTFNKGVFYNSKQCTGEQSIIPKDASDPLYMWNQVEEIQGGMLASYHENVWHINSLRDYRINYNVPIFTKNLPSPYWIDKSLNVSSISFTKDWTEVQPLRDKYLIGRLTLDNNPTVKLIVCYLIETQTQSDR